MCSWDTDCPVLANRKKTNDRHEKGRHGITHPQNVSVQISNKSNIQKNL